MLNMIIRFKKKIKNVIKLKDIFLRLGISHLLVLSLTISIFTLVYLSSINIISKNMQQLQQMTLRQYKIFIDTQLLGIMQLSKEISYNRDIRNICKKEEDSQSSLVFKRYYVTTNLRLLSITNNLIENVSLYDMDTNTIISGQGSYSIDEWCKFETKIDINEFKNKILQFKDNSVTGFILLKRKNTVTNLQENLLAYVYWVSQKSQFTKDVISIVVLKRDLMSSQSISKDSNIFITDIKKNIIFSENFQHSKKIIDNLTIKTLLDNNTQNYKNTGVFAEKSDIKDLLYISSVNTFEYGKQINIMRNLFIICTIISVILAILIAFTVSSRKIIKINNIFSLLGISNPSYRDEYECIKQAVTNIVEEKTNMQNYINQQTNTIFTFKLEDLIQGKLDDDNTYALINSMDERFKEKSFFTLIISFLYDESDEQSSLLHNFSNGSRHQNKISLSMIEENIIKAFDVGQKSNCKKIMAEVEDMIACIVSYDDVKRFSYELISDIRKAICEIDDENRKEFGFRTFIGVSCIYEGMNNISKAYDEALDALEYIKILGGLKRVIFSDELNEFVNNSEVTDNHDIYVDGAEEQFEMCIKLREYSKAKIIVEETFSKYLSENSLPSIHILQCKLMGLMNIFLNSIRNKTFEYEELKKTRAFSKALKCKTIVDMKKELIKILSYADELYLESFIAATSNIGEIILNYIRENYTDPNLNVNALSEKFSINISLLSRIIKNKTGYGPLEILQRLRLEKAKKLLSNSNSLNKVAEEIGLLNDAALIRLFKKYEKTTPGKYKDINSSVPAK